MNTLLIQRVLAEPQQFQQMRREDFRALTPLIYSHVTRYGVFRLDLSERMQIEEIFRHDHLAHRREKRKYQIVLSQPEVCLS